MKDIGNLIQGTKDILDKGKEKLKRGAVIGSYVGLGALAGGGCTIPPQAEPQRSCEIITCNYWVDANGNNLLEDEELTGIKDNFSINEPIRFVTKINGDYLGAEVNTQIFDSSGELVGDWDDAVLYKGGMISLVTPINLSKTKGDYLVIVKVNGIPKARKEIRIY